MQSTRTYPEGSRRREVETAAAGGEHLERGTSFVAQPLPGGLEHGQEAALPGGRIGGGRGDGVDPLPQLVEHLLRRQNAGPGGEKLQRERHPGDLGTDALDRGRMPRAIEGSIAALRTGDEEFLSIARPPVTETETFEHEHPLRQRGELNARRHQHLQPRA